MLESNRIFLTETVGKHHAGVCGSAPRSGRNLIGRGVRVHDTSPIRIAAQRASRVEERTRAIASRDWYHERFKCFKLFFLLFVKLFVFCCIH